MRPATQDIIQSRWSFVWRSRAAEPQERRHLAGVAQSSLQVRRRQDAGAPRKRAHLSFGLVGGFEGEAGLLGSDLSSGFPELLEGFPSVVADFDFGSLPVRKLP